MSDFTVGVRLKADNSGFVGEVRLSREELEKLSRGGEQAGRGLDRGARSADRMGRESAQMARKAERANRMLSTLRNTVVALGAIQGARMFVQMADAAQQLENRLKLVTDSEAELAERQRELFDLSQQTRTEVQATTNLYVRLAQALQGTGTEQERVLQITEAFNKALQISGATQTEAAAATQQFSQAIAGNVVRAEEFNSLIDASPRLIRALIEELDQVDDVGALRQLLEDGELTRERVLQAMTDALPRLRQEFSNLDRTASGAFTQLRNDLLRSIGLIDEGSGATDALQEGIDGIREVVSSENFRSGATAFVQMLTSIVELGGDAVGILGKIATNFGLIQDAIAGSERAGGGLDDPFTDLSQFFEALGKLGTAADRSTKAGRIAETLDQVRDVRDELSDLRTVEDPSEQQQFRMEQLQNRLEGLRATYERLTGQVLQFNQAQGGSGRDALQDALDAADLLGRSDGGGPTTPPRPRETPDRDDLGGRREYGSAAERLGVPDESTLERLNQAIRLQRMDARARAQTEAVIEAQNAAMREGNLLSQEQVQRIRARAGTLHDLRNATEEAGEAERARQRLLEQGRRLTERMLTPTERYKQELLDIQRLQTAGAISPETASRAQTAASERLQEAQERTNETLQRGQEFAREFGQSFSSAAEDAILRGEEMSDVLAGLGQDLARLALRSAMNPFFGAVTEGFQGLVSDMFTSSSPAPTFTGGAGGGYGQPLPSAHEGGVAGDPGARQRRVDPRVFDGARRYHTGGLVRGEVPIIAKMGEEVLTREDPRHRANGGGGRGDVHLNVINEGPPMEARKTGERPTPDGGREIDVMLVRKMEQAIDGGALDRPMVRNYGVSRQGQR